MINRLVVFAVLCKYLNGALSNKWNAKLHLPNFVYFLFFADQKNDPIHDSI